MQEDRELLELAAKAAGIHLEWNSDNPVEIFGRWNGNPNEPPEQDWRDWNPLTDDGDALRLAVKIGWEECLPFIEGALDAARIDGECQLSAVRIAIVRAAADIGRAMP